MQLTQSQIEAVAEWMKTEKWGILGLPEVMCEVRSRFIEAFSPKEKHGSEPRSWEEIFEEMIPCQRTLHEQSLKIDFMVENSKRHRVCLNEGLPPEAPGVGLESENETDKPPPLTNTD